MPQTVNIPDVGAVNFPDGMTATEISNESSKLYNKAQVYKTTPKDEQNTSTWSNFSLSDIGDTNVPIPDAPRDEAIPITPELRHNRKEKKPLSTDSTSWTDSLPDLERYKNLSNLSASTEFVKDAASQPLQAINTSGRLLKGLFLDTVKSFSNFSESDDLITEPAVNLHATEGLNVDARKSGLFDNTIFYAGATKGEQSKDYEALHPVVKGLAGAAEMVPGIVAATGLSALGVPMPLAFGMTEFGRAAVSDIPTAPDAWLNNSTKAGLIGAAIPYVGAFGKNATGTMLANLIDRGIVNPQTIGNTGALVAEEIGGLTAMGVASELLKAKEYWNATPEQRLEMLYEGLGSNLAFLAFSYPALKSGAESHTQKIFRQKSEDLGLGIAVLTDNTKSQVFKDKAALEESAKLTVETSPKKLEELVGNINKPLQAEADNLQAELDKIEKEYIKGKAKLTQDKNDVIKKSKGNPILGRERQSKIDEIAIKEEELAASSNEKDHEISIRKKKLDDAIFENNKENTLDAPIIDDLKNATPLQIEANKIRIDFEKAQEHLKSQDVSDINKIRNDIEKLKASQNAAYDIVKSMTRYHELKNTVWEEIKTKAEDPAAPPVGPAAPPVGPAAPPVDPAAPPVDPTAPPVDPAAPPVDPTAPIKPLIDEKQVAIEGEISAIESNLGSKQKFAQKLWDNFVMARRKTLNIQSELDSINENIANIGEINRKKRPELEALKNNKQIKEKELSDSVAEFNIHNENLAQSREELFKLRNERKVSQDALGEHLAQKDKIVKDAQALVDAEKANQKIRDDYDANEIKLTASIAQAAAELEIARNNLKNKKTDIEIKNEQEQLTNKNKSEKRILDTDVAKAKKDPSISAEEYDALLAERTRLRTKLDEELKQQRETIRNNAKEQNSALTNKHNEALKTKADLEKELKSHKANPPKTPKVEPVKVEPVKVEPVKVEPAKVEPVKVEPVKVEPAKVEPFDPYAAETDKTLINSHLEDINKSLSALTKFIQNFNFKIKKIGESSRDINNTLTGLRKQQQALSDGAAKTAIEDNIKRLESDLSKFQTDKFIYEEERSKAIIQHNEAKLSRNSAENRLNELEGKPAVKFRTDDGIDLMLDSGDDATAPFDFSTSGAALPKKNDPLGANKVTNLLKDLFKGVPVREGVGKVKGALGYFNRKIALIRVQALTDIKTVAHELGHMLQHILFPETVSFDTTVTREGYSDFGKIFDSELMPLGKKTSGKNYSPEQIRNEGTAEFTRLWLSDKVKARAAAPSFYDYLENIIPQKAPKTWEAMLTAQKQIHRYYEQPSLMRVLGAIGSPVVDSAFYSSKRIEKAWNWSRNWLDRDYPFKRAIDQARKAGVESEILDQVFAQLDYISSGSIGRSLNQEGFVELNGLILRDSNGARVHLSITEIMGKISNVDRATFSAYLISRRIHHMLRKHESLGTKMPETGLEKDDVRNVYKDNFEKFEKHARNIDDYQENLVRLLVESGYMTPKQAEEMHANNIGYVPFHRIMDMVEGGSRGVGNKNPLTLQFTGSTKNMIDPIEAILRNSILFRKMAEENINRRIFLELVSDKIANIAEEVTTKIKGDNLNEEQVGRILKDKGINAAVKALHEMGVVDANGSFLDSNGQMHDFMPPDLSYVLWRSTKTESARDSIVSVFKEGKKLYYKIEDPFFYNHLTSKDATAAASYAKNKVNKFLAFQGGLLRTGITIRLPFQIAAYLKDTPTAFINSQVWTIPFWDSGKAMFSMMKLDKHWRAFKEQGGGGVNYSFDTKSQAKFIERMTKQDPRTMKEWALAISNPKTYAEISLYIGSLFEQSHRFAEFKALSEKGVNRITAANAAAEITLPFHRFGEWLRVFNRQVPFLNPTIRGAEQMITMHTDLFVPGKRKYAASRILKATMMVGGMSVGAWILGKDDPDIENLSDARKTFFWNFNLKNLIKAVAAIGGKEAGEKLDKMIFPNYMFSIPKPPIGWLYANGTEAVLNFANKKDPKVLANYLGTVTDAGTVVPGYSSFMFPVLKTGSGVAFNYDVFTKNPLVSDGKSNLPTDMQTGKDTTQITQWLGKISNVSPAKIDFGLKSTLGPIGINGANAADWLLIKAGVFDAGPPEAKTFSRIPVVGMFFPSPFTPAKQVSQFYEAAIKMEKEQARVASMKTDARFKQLTNVKNDLQYYGFYNPDRVGAIRAARENLTAISVAMQNVQESKKDNAEKTKSMLSLTQSRNRLAQAGMTFFHPNDLP